MSEQLGNSFEMIPVHETARHLEQWLGKEIVSASTGKNGVLDNWELYRQSLDMEFDDFSNTFARKTYSHFDRLNSWTLGFEMYSDLLHDEYYMARQLFCAQMQIAGGFRRQCFVQSKSAEEYMQRHLEEGPTGIDIAACIAQRLEEYTDTDQLIPGAAYHDTPAARLIANTRNTNEAYLEAAKTAHEQAKRDAGQQDSPATELLKYAQELWTRLAVDYMMFNANEPGKSLDDIAFLEPKSISEDPQVYYPFRQR